MKIRRRLPPPPPLRRGALALLACAALAGGTDACSRNPATGQRQLSLISEAQEIQIGRENDQAIVAQLGLYGDEGLQNYVQELGARLAARSERPNLPWTFRVVDDPVVNAFALPGGFIYVTRGIMAHVENEAQLAGIIGHEIGHVTARHSVSRMSSAQLAQLGLAVGSILSETVERYSGFAGAGLQLLFLKYSRDDENQADELGVRYMTRQRFDARHMPAIFTMLDRVSQEEGGGRVPEWLATHPNPGNRASRLERMVAAMPAESVGTVVNEESYLRRLDGMVYGTDPREGYFNGATFLHPQLRFQLTFPQGWNTTNQKQAVGAVSPQQDAIVQVTIAQGNDPTSAAQRFASQEGLAAGSAQRVAVNGLNGVILPFGVQTQQSTVRGSALFVAHGNAVFRVLGYAPEARWDARQAAAEGAMQSFRPLTDPAAINVQPLRLDVVRADRGASLEQLARERASPVPAQKLALLNQVDAGAALPSGQLVKLVTGQPTALGRRE
jgi:predicted Zn-dependent protease